jgi:hypothetical protein
MSVKSVQFVLGVLLLTALSGCGSGSHPFAVEKNESSSSSVQDGDSAPALKVDLHLEAEDVDADWDRKEDALEWTKITLRALEKHGAALLTEDADDARPYCSRYNRLTPDERGRFWVKMISAMAAHESSFREGLNYTEKFNDSSNTRVISRGLLQISKESAKLYGCDVAVGADLLKAEVNLPCGVKILNHWMAHDKRIGSGSSNNWRGGARYWSVLRKSDSKGEIQDSLDKLGFCKSHE